MFWAILGALIVFYWVLPIAAGIFFLILGMFINAIPQPRIPKPIDQNEPKESEKKSA